MNPIQSLIAVLCGPDGKCCIAGSAADRQAIDDALAALQATPQPSPTALELMTEYSNGKAWALEEIAKEFDRRAVLADGSQSVGRYEPGEPAQIVRNIALKGGA